MKWPRSLLPSSTAQVLAAVILVVLGGALALLGSLTARDIGRSQDADRAAAARVLADRLERVFARAAAATDAAAPQQPVRVSDLHGAVLTSEVASPLTENPVVVDAAGTVIATHPAERLALDSELDDDERKGGGNDYIAEAIRTGDITFAIVEPVDRSVEPPVLHPPVIRVAQPLRGPDDRYVAAFVTGIEIADSSLGAIVATSSAIAQTGLDAQLAVVGGNQAIVTAGGNALPAGEGPAAAVVQGSREELERGGRQGPFAVDAPDGSGALIVHGQPIRAGWHVLLYQPEGTLRATANAARTRVWALAGLLTLAGLAPLVGAERRVRAAREEVERAKRSLLAVAGHELRTPLTVVRGMSATVLRRWETLPDQMRKQLVGTIDRQARTLDHLIERLLFAAHVESGVSGTVNVRSVDVAPVVASAADHHRSLTPTHEIVARIDRPLRALADEKALDQVLFHLLDNAVKFSPAGGEISVTATHAGNRVEITVEDRGIGLPADATSIFERFGQTEPVDRRTSEEGGVGLGLYIVKMLTTLMGGQVRAEPAEPRGSRFTVSLRTDGS